MERKLVEVERGNVVLRVPESEVERYIDIGYNLIGDDGKIIKSSIPNDIGTLQKAFIEHTKEIEELKEKLAHATQSKERRKKAQ